ncbi:MAG: DUF5615 family PIN-like protein [Burkholderiales bacterium]
MTIKILVDVNLSPEWVPLFIQAGWEALHWTTCGKPNAADGEIMKWARDNGYLVFTHDLDFGTALALTNAAGPSVLQLRGQNVLPESIAGSVTATLRHYEAELAAGALVVVEKNRSRVRVLPLQLAG